MHPCFRGCFESLRCFILQRWKKEKNADLMFADEVYNLNECKKPKKSLTWFLVEELSLVKKTPLHLKISCTSFNKWWQMVVCLPSARAKEGHAKYKPHFNLLYIYMCVWFVIFLNLIGLLIKKCDILSVSSSSWDGWMSWMVGWISSWDGLIVTWRLEMEKL